jgi:hypothetical protein
MNPIETYSSRTYMPIEISSYKELLRDGHTTVVGQLIKFTPLVLEVDEEETQQHDEDHE